MSEDHEEQHSTDAGPAVGDTSSASEKENDTFEDAVDTGSVRSLTKRKTSYHAPQKSVSGETEPDQTSESETTPAEHVNGDDKSDKEDLENGVHPASARSSHVSTTELDSVNLDNVNLDDDSTVKEQEEPVVIEKGPTKKLSLSNITSALPSMPWSPSNTSDSPSRSPNSAAGSIVPPPAAPAASATAAAAAAGRKFTSPFSWMSRSSTQKDPLTSPPITATTSNRRNTSSSIATLTSNPEMMLSKLEEENEGRPSAGSPRLARNSLKDRFKLVRMREEAGITVPTGEDDKTGGAIGNLISRSTTLGVLSPTGENGPELTPSSPVPSPNPELAPGTASGVSAGPSAMADSQVDWDLWQSVVYEGPAAVARTSADELNKAIATGIPNVIRGVVWQVMAQSKNDDLEIVYKELVARGTEKENRNSNGTSVSSSSKDTLSIDKETTASSASSVHSEHSAVSGMKSPPLPPRKNYKDDAAMLQKLEKTIRRDMGARTSYSKHAAASGLQDGLFGVCKAYALFDEGVGYAQGMNFLVMPLLFNMPEEEAFCLLVRLMNHYKLRDLFIQDMPGLHLRLYQFERLLEDLEPALYCHLHRRGISPHLYATQWFLTLFAYRFPLQLVLRIYDLIFSEGLSAILKFGIVLMQKNSETLLGMSDMAQLTSYLKDKLFDVYVDQAPSSGSILENGFFGSSSANIDKEVYRADQLVRDACEVKVTPELLKVYTTEWEEKTKLEKERETELETLRTNNASYVIKIRKLEERIETCDREQASMATEMVHTKVENEEIKDENESLKGQVRELRVVIEKQPEEIEEAWKMERDDLMKRNEKVHEENQKLEKELAELEEQLVQTKMQYAEVNSQHETLSRKWSELKRQFA